MRDKEMAKKFLAMLIVMYICLGIWFIHSPSWEKFGIIVMSVLTMVVGYIIGKRSKR